MEINKNKIQDQLVQLKDKIESKILNKIINKVLIH